jgi:tetrahydromethanopterin S-methyltransferase subunit G|tara:strand:+ start:375 stop:659 length:285 start_codon:yes stop_codon:yes gene_type:complete
MATGTQAARLDRIEEKIDNLSDAMVSLARAEEKLVAIEKNNHTNFERMNRFSQKLDDIERKVEENAHTVGVINKLFWILIAAAVAGIMSAIWMN